MPEQFIFQTTNGAGDQGNVNDSIEAKFKELNEKPFINLEDFNLSGRTVTYTLTNAVGYSVDTVYLNIGNKRFLVGTPTNLKELAALLNKLDIGIFKDVGSTIVYEGFITVTTIVKSPNNVDTTLFTPGMAELNDDFPTTEDYIRWLALLSKVAAVPFQFSPQLSRTVLRGPTSGPAGIPFFGYFNFTELNDTFQITDVSLGRVPIVDTANHRLFDVNLFPVAPFYVDAATDSPLPAYSYTTSGRVSTITITAHGIAPVIDGIDMAVDNTFLFQHGTSDAHNGLYIWTVSSSGTSAKAIRLTGATTPTGMYPQYVIVRDGILNGHDIFFQTMPSPTVGTDPIIYAPYGAGTGWSANGNSFASGTYIGTNNGEPFIIRTHALERMRILATGQVIIGATSATATLFVKGTSGLPPFKTENLAGTHSWEFRDDGTIRRNGNLYSTFYSTDTSYGQQAGRVFVSTGNLNAVYGYRSGFNLTGARDTFYGASSGNTAVDGTDLTLIGYASDVSTASLSNGIAIGSGATITANNQFVAGSATVPVTEVKWGYGVSVTNPATPTRVTISATDVTGASRSAATSILAFSVARGSGPGDSGNMEWYYAPPSGVSGTSATRTLGMTFTGNTGLFTIGNTGAAITQSLLKLQNTGGAASFFVSNATPQSAITATRGSITLVDTGSEGKAYLKTSLTGTTVWSELLTTASILGITIDSTTIASGTAKAVLFESDTNKVSEDASVFTWNPTTNNLNLGTSGNTGATLVVKEGASGYMLKTYSAADVELWAIKGDGYIYYAGSKTAFVNASNPSTTFFGYQANNSSGSNTAFGYQTLTAATGSFSTGFGEKVLTNITSGNSHAAFGYFAGSTYTGTSFTRVGITTGVLNTFLGHASGASANSISYSTVIGAYSWATASNQLIIGGHDGTTFVGINDVYIGQGFDLEATTSPTMTSVNIQGTGIKAGRTDVSAATGYMALCAAIGTGTGVGGDWRFYSAPASTTNNTRNSLFRQIDFRGDGYGINYYQKATPLVPGTPLTDGVIFYINDRAGAGTASPYFLLEDGTTLDLAAAVVSSQWITSGVDIYYTGGIVAVGGAPIGTDPFEVNDGANILFSVNAGFLKVRNAAGNGFLNINSTTGLYELGDLNASASSTKISLDDSIQTAAYRATGGHTFSGIATFNNNVTINAKLTVTGAIDPTHLYLDEQGSDPSNVANKGILYTKDDSAVTQLFYMDSAGTVNQLTTSAGVSNRALNNLNSVSINTSLLAQTGVDLGSTAKPFRDIYLWGSGTFATTYLKLTGTPTSTRTLTLPDATDTFGLLAAAQAFTNKSYNGLTLTATTGTFTLTNLKTFSVTNTLTFSGTDTSTLNIGGGGTLGSNAYTSTAYAPLASPTFTGTVVIPTPFTIGAVSMTSTGTQLNYLASATGTTGTASTNVVFSTSPTLITPVLGVATMTSINKYTMTAPATGSTITILDGKTFTLNNTIIFAGTDSTTMTFPSTSATIARTDAANSFTGAQTFNSSAFINTSSGVFRTTNGGSNITATCVIDPSSSLTSGTAFTFDATNFRFGITTANGTRRIQTAAMGLANAVTTAGSESADLDFYTKTAATAVAAVFRLTSIGDAKLLVAGGGIYIKEGSNCTMGVATLVAGTVTVSTSKVTANSRIFLEVQSLGTVAVATPVAITARSAGVSFAISSSSITDTSVIAWLIMEPS